MVNRGKTVRRYLALLGLLVLERLGELVVSRRHVRRALAAGAVEHGAGHFPLMVAMHALFPVACALEVLVGGERRRFRGSVGYPALAALLLAQGLRYWAIGTLGDRWTVRVIVPRNVPRQPRSEDLVSAGPYAYVAHPNYVAVATELAAVPLIHGAWVTALAFSLANAAVLAVRIPCEERALASAFGASRLQEARDGR